MNVVFPLLFSASGNKIGNAITNGTAGSVLFVDASGNLGQDNSNFFFNSVTHILTVSNPTHFGGNFSIAAAPENSDIGQGAFGRAGEVGFYAYNGSIGFYTGSGGTPTQRMSIALTTGVITLPNGYHQNTLLESSLTAAFTDATGVLTSTALSVGPLLAGRSYRIEGILPVSNTATTEGVQFNFAGGTATATTFFVAAQAVGSVTAGTLASTTLAGVLNYTVITGTDYIYIRGFIKVNAAGTLILKAAENTQAIGTLTIGIGAWLACYDTVQK